MSMLTNATLLPRPGKTHGSYPQRREPGISSESPEVGGLGPPGWTPLVLAWQRLTRAARARAYRAQVTLVEQATPAWTALNDEAWNARRDALKPLLRRSGLTAALRVEALACAADAGRRALGRDAYGVQVHAALVLLDNRLAEMATGEGKTHAAALGAAVAALAGIPVHLMTANDYLVARDHEALTPMFDRLGLTCGAVLGSSDPEQRRFAYACDITYCTAREVAFDYLRDRVAAEDDRGAPLLRGLCMAILDEADSLLIDEASMPLILSEAINDPQQRAHCFQALALARELQPGIDCTVRPTGGVDWLASGRERLERLSTPMGGLWAVARHRLDLTGLALEALHRLERDRHYVVRDDAVMLLDPVTGRTSPGRVWSRGLQTLVELKEGVRVSPVVCTRTQISFQRFFPRYLRLCGMSGSLRESAVELHALYGLTVEPVALRKPLQRTLRTTRLYGTHAQRLGAAASRVAQLHAQGRPILIGTDSVDDTLRLSAQLTVMGLAHQVLNAHQDLEEAEIIARAGAIGAITVATTMAGRGTDIVLGDGVAARGGLHVLQCQDTALSRQDRQLRGRSARQGDPGSAEVWHALDSRRHARLRAWRSATRWSRVDTDGQLHLNHTLLRLALRLPQWLEERSGARQRRRLLEQDRQWEHQFAPKEESL